MLSKILQVKREEVNRIVLKEPIEVERHSLLDHLQKSKRKLGLIAEVKKASPSKGVIKDVFDPIQIAKEYVLASTDALSVLTDEQFFKGHPSYLTAIKQQVNVPVLRKDFIIDRKQIEESVRLGADAILLIAAVLEKNQLHEFYTEAYEKGLQCLVEVHSLVDIENVFSTFSPDIIGINNRDLRTFQTNIYHTINMRKEISNDTLVVSESGIRTFEDINILEKSCDAVLVGETFMRATSPRDGIYHLFGEQTKDDEK